MTNAETVPSWFLLNLKLVQVTSRTVDKNDLKLSSPVRTGGTEYTTQN